MHLINQIVSYLSSHKKTIVTNCRRWHFFNVNNLNESQYEYLKIYSKIKLMLEEDRNWTVEELKKQINDLLSILEKNKHEIIDKLIDKNIKKDKKWYKSTCEILKETAIVCIANCETKKIDLLPNTKPKKEDQITIERIDPHKEWKDLIAYIREFINE